VLRRRTIERARTAAPASAGPRGRTDLAGELIEQIQRLPEFEPLLAVSELRSHVVAVLQIWGCGRWLTLRSEESPAYGHGRPKRAGKTTMAIKLAALKAGRSGGKVALVTLDGHRIGAIVQLAFSDRF